MATRAIHSDSACTVDGITPSAGYVGGQLVQLASGLAAVIAGLRALASGEPFAAQTEGKFKVPVTSGVKLLDGQGVFLDYSADTATYFRGNDRDFYLGVAVGDSANGYVTVDLNKAPKYVIALGDGVSEWVTEATNGLGVTGIIGGGAKLEFDAVAEVAQAAIYSAATVDPDSQPIFEGWFAVYNIGDNAALDITIGLASGSHATDFQSVANFVALHLDGNNLSLNVESADGDSDVAPADSLVDAVDDTKFFLQIDARDKSDVRVLVNGADIVPSGTTLTLAEATNELKPIVHMEKTSDDTVADVRVLSMGVRTSTTPSTAA